MKQKTEITLEVEETTTVRHTSSGCMALCLECQALVDMLTPTAAALFFGLSEREIFRLIEAGKIHFLEAERVFVCTNSLTNGPEPQLLTNGS